MSEDDEAAAGGERARRLRQEIVRLRRPIGPGEDRSSPRPVSPREFTDTAAGHASCQANQRADSVEDPETEGGARDSTDRAE